MKTGKVLIVGGGMAGLSAGIYARRSGLEAHIFEHGFGLGGVCTAWRRGDYVVDGCIHWIIGGGPEGMFRPIYEEVGLLDRVELRRLDEFMKYHDAAERFSVTLSSDLEAYKRQLIEVGPEDADAVEELIDAARRLARVDMPYDPPHELRNWFEHLVGLWEMRREVSTMLRYRKPMGAWIEENIENPRLRRYLSKSVSPDMPVMFFMMTLTALEAGQMSRPVGGTAAFRDAVVGRFTELGGTSTLHATVDEILVEGDRAVGVRLADGTIEYGDDVICTASAPETVLRLLGARYDAKATRERLKRWRLFDPICLLSWGVSNPMDGVAPEMMLDHLKPLPLASKEVGTVVVRTFNDEPSVAPPGHTVVQTMLETSYDWWAQRGDAYHTAKQEVADRVAEVIEPHLPGFAGKVEMTDIATPLTFWRHARSWRGAYEGWLPTPDAFFGHVPKRLDGLGSFYMAGQWVEPGGGVPTALMSGRQAVQILCADRGIPFGVDTAST